MMSAERVPAVARNPWSVTERVRSVLCSTLIPGAGLCRSSKSHLYQRALPRNVRIGPIR
ncbi:hypothetical protein A8924_0121 [Saccharopolyspora erythraea NRRL 2338]|nr:hypothetical protein A8924_0121 [Saccharopolyspora erythraea NRRL 2338]